MGLDIYLRWKGITEEEKKAQYTGFEQAGSAGYLRSSYNDGGFNSWARRCLGDKGFYYIFDYAEGKEKVIGVDEDGDEETGFFPDWDQSEERTRTLLAQAEQLDNLSVIRVSGPGSPAGTTPATYETVLDMYREQIKRGYSFDWYSNWQGFWMPKDPPTVKAALWGKGYIGQELYLITESAESPHIYYIEVLRDHVLPFIELGRSKDGYVHWSG